MNIKTITSVDGVNAVDFGSAASRFYWFKNIGTTTVYVSGDPDITADYDGLIIVPGNATWICFSQEKTDDVTGIYEIVGGV